MKTFKFILNILSCLMIKSAFASISCTTIHQEHEFIINSKQIAFSREFSTKGQDRSISSQNQLMEIKRPNVKYLDLNIRNKHQGFERTLYLDNLLFQIHLSSLEKFDHKNDFLIITNPKGHSMTYPILCKNKI